MDLVSRPDGSQSHLIISVDLSRLQSAHSVSLNSNEIIHLRRETANLPAGAPGHLHCLSGE